MHRILLAVAALSATAAALLASVALAAAPPAGAWEIGPIIRGKNYSINMPLRPSDTRGGPSFEIPKPRATAYTPPPPRASRSSIFAWSDVPDA